mgnify:CR=1 FL=1
MFRSNPDTFRDIFGFPGKRKKIEQNIELSDFDRERLSGLEILFIKDTEVSIEK